MKKEIRFSSSIDTKEFDRAIENMQRKLQQIYQGSDTSKMLLETRTMAARGGIGREPTQAEKARSMQEDMRVRRELGRFIKDELKVQEDLVKKIEQQKRLVKDLENAYKNLAASAEDVNSAKKEALTLEEKLRASVGATQEAIQRRQMPGFEGVGGWGGVAQRGMNAYAMGGGVSGAVRGMMRGANALRIASPLSFYGGIGAAAGLAVNMYGQIDERFNLAQRETLSAQGTAARAYSQPLMDALSRNGFESALYASENKEALQRASDEIKRTRRNDLLKLGGSILAIVGGAALAAGGIGASSTGVGAILGAGLTVKGGLMMAGGAYALKTALFDQGGIIDRATGTYEASLKRQQAAAYQENLQSLKNLNPLKQIAAERYQREAMANLPLQRALGLSDEEINLQLMSGTSAGFMTDTTRQAMAGILEAGGSTRAARELGTQANLLQRNLGLVNATQAMGRISALTGGAQESEAAMVKVLAEAFSLGLDDSQFRAEQNKFVDIATSVISRAGAMGVQNQGDLTRQLASFVTGPGMAQVQGAQTAFSLMSQTTATTGGARGAIQASILNRDSRFKDLNIDERNALLSLSEEQILAGGPLVEGILKKTGMSAQDLIQTVKRPAFITRADVELKAQRLKEMQSKTGPLTEREQSEMTKLRGEVIAGMAYDNPAILSLKPAEQDALLKGYLSGGQMSPEDQKAYEAAQERLSAARARGATTAGDKLEEARAASDEAALQVVKTFKNELDSASTGAKRLAQEAEAAAVALQKAFDPKNFDPAKSQEAINKIIELFSKLGQGPQGAGLVQEKGAPSGR